MSRRNDIFDEPLLGSQWSRLTLTQPALGGNSPFKHHSSPPWLPASPRVPKTVSQSRLTPSGSASPVTQQPWVSSYNPSPVNTEIHRPPSPRVLGREDVPRPYQPERPSATVKALEATLTAGEFAVGANDISRGAFFDCLLRKFCCCCCG